ncbi:hypothetical protein [Actinomycetospora atypica]|uniref:Uncharacterized protein n=1 Tax=Actinomycetospora atypica TaxID=1290095 RepID=A0ABV9YHI3_9PSEU
MGSDTRDFLRMLSDHADGLASSPSPMGNVLLEAVQTSGHAKSVIVVMNARAEQGIRDWLSHCDLEPANIQVVGRGDVQRDCHSYLLGPPALLGPKSYLAPTCPKLSYIYPRWVPDRALPISFLTEHSTDGVRPKPSIRIAIDTTVTDALDHEDVHEQSDDDFVDDTHSNLSWSDVSPPSRAPLDDEVLARRVMLAGGRSMLLDQDGGWIRALDPDQPAGERVYQQDEKTIVPGVYLILREGITNSDALYELTMYVLGEKRHAVETAQREWKDSLARALRRHGTHQVARQLDRAGVEASTRAPAWIEPTLARPQSTNDFRNLLVWLGLEPVETYISNADNYSRARYRAVNEVRGALESALSATDLDLLRANGIVKLRLETSGFASIIAARVLAISPDEYLVPRTAVRIPEFDRSARWLE